MAGPWFVDPENGLTTNNGLSESAPWKLIPGQTGATSQTGYGVVAGDTINVKNGTTTSLRVVFPQNNLTYRGYGVASNVLTLTLPARNPTSTVQKPVSRQWGAHEGMWIVDAPSETLSVINFVGRSGCTLEDCHVVAPMSETTVSIGTSGLLGVGATVRRCRISGSDSQGLQAYTTACVFEDVLIEDIDEDGCTLAANAANSYRAGTADIIRRLSVINPGKDTLSAVGDGFQTLRTTDRFESSLTMEDIYVYKTSTVKQAMVFSDVLGGLSLKRFHLDNGGAGTTQILFTGIGGAFAISDGYMRGGGNANAAFRFDGPQGMETGTTLSIRNVVSVDSKGGFFTVGSSNSSCTVDGAITLSNNVSDGVNVQGLSFSGDISSHAGANVTLGSNASLAATNNVLASTGAPSIRLPTSGGNSAKWPTIKNCCASSFAIGSTAYATVADFQAAHSYATGNISSDPLLTANYRPKAGSPLLAAGTHLGYRRDLEGKQRPNPPAIGAYDTATLRAVL